MRPSLILTLVCLTLLAGCTVSRPAPPPPVFQPVAGAADGGRLIMTLGATDPDTIDPALVSDTTSSFVVRQLFSGLVRLDENLEVQPDLAEAWQISEDGLVYTFTLSEDARFADGTPIVADDVRYSLERAADPDLAPFLPAATYLTDIVGVRERLDRQADSISGVVVVDERTVQITIDGAKSYFLAKLAHPTSFVVDRRQADDGPLDQVEFPNGSGPFVIESWQRGAQLDLARNLNFYREQARLSRVRMLIGAAANNPIILYEEGDIDIAGVPSYALARVQDQSSPLSGQLVSVPQLSLQYLGMNVAVPPFDDPLVRRAFTLLIDRARLAEVTLAGSATPARGILPPGIPGYDPQLPEVAPDLDEARRLLAESRYGGPEGLPPIVAYGGWAATLRDIAEEELGIEIEVRSYEEFGAYLDALDSGSLPLYAMGWVADYPDPENFLDLLFRTRSGENHTSYSSPELDALLDRAAVEQDEARRWALYREAERLIIADAPVIPLYHDVEHLLVKPYVKGLTVTPMGILDLSTVELAR